MLKINWLSAIFVVMTLTASAEEITVLADPWCPYTCEADSEQPGLVLEIASKALASSGYQLNYKNKPWDEAVALVRNGEFDAVAGAYKSDAPDFIFTTEAVAASRNCFFVKTSTEWHFTGRKSLTQLESLGIVEGYSYGKRFNAFIKDNPDKITTVKGNNPLAENIANLSNGKIKAMIEEEQVTRYYLAKQGISDQYKTAGCARPTRLYLGFSPAKKSSEALAKALNDGLLKIKGSKEIQALYDQYGLIYNDF